MLLSIIIPCYNSARFIASTLDMLISQDLTDFEVIVINDGSTDSTSEIVHSYSDKYPCIKVIDKINEGVSVARNTGIDACCGEYVYFLDSDDTLPDDTLNFFRNILTSHRDFDMFGFGYISTQNEKLLKTYVSKNFSDCKMNNSQLTEGFFTKKLPLNICSTIYKRTFLNENTIRFVQGVKIGEDVEFILKAVLQARSLYYNSRICFNYQIRDDSTMQGYKVYKNVKSWITNKNIIDALGKEEYSKFYNYWIINRYIGNLCMYLLYGKKDLDTEDDFIQTKYILRLSTISLSKVNIVGKFLSLIPLKFMFKVLKK